MTGAAEMVLVLPMLELLLTLVLMNMGLMLSAMLEEAAAAMKFAAILSV